MALTGSASIANELHGSASTENELQGNLGSGRELQGSVESGGEVRGKMSSLEMIRGHSAFEVAVINGFSGTEEEWLASLKGKSGNDGRGIKKVEITASAYTITYTDNTSETIPVHSSVARISEITLLSARWEGEGNLYSQVVDVAGITEYSQVDLTPGVEQLAVFYEKDLTFVTENDGGVLTVYAIGQKPENDYTIQVTITEVQA